ncbi:PepSY domain-containing protein [Maribacter polysiphoniae]|uniref:PepSY domain-containing protein n=3 Tax=Maribacter polysiphoniae TaxID=429344 RepID=A0ABR7VV88_9FLAO|nr:PepSY domain-containing protein [Maribacter polysiphoniae]
MKGKKSMNFYMRIVHRYLGFFLAGIMAVYAFSGIILIFRETNFLKSEQTIEKKVGTAMSSEQLGRALHLKNLRISKVEGDMQYFDHGTYNSATGDVKYTAKELPAVLRKLNQLHKASTNQPLFWLNIFFGVSLFFFVVSSFFMFKPKTKTLKEGVYVSIVGVVLTVLLVFMS